MPRRKPDEHPPPSSLPPLSSPPSTSSESASFHHPLFSLVSPPHEYSRTSPFQRTFRSSQTVYTAGGTPIKSYFKQAQRFDQLQHPSQESSLSHNQPQLDQVDNDKTPRKAAGLTAPPVSAHTPRPVRRAAALSARVQSESSIKLRDSTMSQTLAPAESPSITDRASSSASSLATMLRPAQSTRPVSPALPGKPKGRRSELHAQEVDQIRSASRAGSTRAGSPNVQSAPLSGPRRSQTLKPESSSNRTFVVSPSPSPSGSRLADKSTLLPDDADSSTVGRRLDERLRFPQSSDGTSAKPPAKSTQRSPLPDEFRAISDDKTDRLNNSLATIGTSHRRRYASDAQTSDLPTYDFEGGSRASGPRLSIESGSNQRHLAAAMRSRTSSGPNGASVAVTRSRAGSRTQASQWDDSFSPRAESTRLRKDSQPSSAGSRARPSSRLSSTSRGDVFDDTVRSPLMLSRMLRPDLPPEAIERVKALQTRREALQSGRLAAKDSYGPAVDDIRAQIEDIDVRGSTIPSSSHSSSGVSSAPRPRPSQLLQAERLAAQNRSGPASEPRRMGDFRRERPAVPPSAASSAAHAEDRATWSRASHGQEPLRRFASQAAFDRAPTTPEVGNRPSSRFSSIARGVTPGPVLTATSSAAVRNATTPRERNLLVSYDIFERHFAGSGNTSTPVSPSRRTGSESVELVEKARTFVDTVTTLNAGLRDIAQFVIQCEIDSEVGGSAPSSAAVLKNLDQALGSLLKFSDNQVRNLGEFLSNFTRADKERNRIGIGANAPHGDQSLFAPRTESRLSSTQNSQWSPSRRSDLQRGATISAHPRHEQNSIDLALKTRRDAPASLRRETRDVREAGTTVDSTNDVGNLRRGIRADAATWEPQDRDDPAVSPTMSVGTLGRLRNSVHGRSVSELSPGPRSPTEGRRGSIQLANGISGTARQQTLRSRASLVQPNSSTHRAPAPLSPRRPKLSDPSVATAIAVSSNAHAVSDTPTSMPNSSSAVDLLSDGPRTSGYGTVPRRQSTAGGGTDRRLYRRNTQLESRPSTSHSPASSSTTATMTGAGAHSPATTLSRANSHRSSGQRAASHRHSIAATSIDSAASLVEPGGDETHGELYDLYAQRSHESQPAVRKQSAVAADPGAGEASDSFEDDVAGQAKTPADGAKTATVPVSSTPPTSARTALRYASQSLGRLATASRASLSGHARGTDQSVWAQPATVD